MLEFGFMCLFDRCARRVRLPAKGIAFVRYTTPEADGARKRTGTRSGKHMGTETEIKLRVHDLKELRAALQRLGARSVFAGTGRVFESNLLFDTPGNQLAKRGELLRIRTEKPVHHSSKRSEPGRERTLLTFKRPLAPKRSPAGAPSRDRHKVREEIELQVQDAQALEKIFEGLGLRGWFRYEKFRTTLQLPKSRRWAKGLLVELDETPIGTFVELEGPPQAIDRVARLLGFSKRDYIVTSYLGLYLQECRQRGEEPGHMVFQKGR
jgi:adenylate cyclase class 2